ncbi:hypothetical protein L211DRAFT_867518 [Terfezia boudieri ATCC MYA-4762]|uniref:Ubiquitin 3 binding protein But2 C-terminal domain-containing protein n=1 Tax=Terfezia boudieri ATCC MYA-4762 TaxID=1051890 RepID=A0A3N4LV57_9PEZI|nr:hypothetical protein L211DRAFT_867518 [Terfezia boudieri ATCC MYA-4762]
MFKQLIPLLLLLLPAVAVAASSQYGNKTFTMTVIGGKQETDIVNLPVLVEPPTGIASVVVGKNFTVPTEVIEAFIYKNEIYRKCKTSPTGACVGFLTKAYGGALTGWYFHFSDTEEFHNLGPGDGPIHGSFDVKHDPNAPSGCKQMLLFHGSGSFWTMCSRGPGIYDVNSMSIMDVAHNGPQCAKHTDYQFKVKYT